MAAGHETSGESVLLQERVALLTRLLFFLSLVSLVIQSTADLYQGHPEYLIGPSYTPSYLATLLFLAAWLGTRRGSYSTVILRTIEVGSLLANSLLSTLAGRYIAATLVPQLASTNDSTVLRHALVWPILARAVHHYTGVLMGFGLALVMVIRAAVVPGSARYSTFVTLLVGVPLLVTSGAGVVPFFGGDRDVRSALNPGDFFAAVVVLSILWGFTVVSCTIIANVMHGLRSEVHQARRLGQYYLLEKLGEGGMGQVFRARHALLRRPTAVKLLLPTRTRASDLARFEREVQLTARLTHPNTITIYDYGRTADGVFYYAMELLEGATLEDVVRQTGPMPPGRVSRILKMVAGALAEAHEVNLVHRDVKPANLFLCSRGGTHDVVKVLDFGLVKDLEADERLQLTHDGALQGTPLYLAPEVIRHPEAFEARSDLYALGSVAYFMLTGRPPFVGRTVVEVCAHHLHSTPDPPSAHIGLPLPAALEELVLACLAKDPSARPASASEVIDRLEALGDLGWTDADARGWWSTHGPSITKRPTELVDATIPVGSEDLAVDAA